MGSRAALGLANEVGKSEPYTVKGVICLAYPLHAEDDKEKLNDEPLKALTIPGLFVSTVNDKTCDSEKLEEILAKNSTVKIKWVEEAEHFRKATGRKENDVFNDTNEIIISWCKEIIKGGSENGAKKNHDEDEGKKEKGDSKDRKRKSEGEGKADEETKKLKEK